MSNPRLDTLLEVFDKRGYKLVDKETGQEIKPSNVERVTCKICDNETPVGKTCMWCLNDLGEKCQ